MGHINFRFMAYVLSKICFIESLMLTVCILVGLCYGEEPLPFVYAVGAALALGLVLRKLGRIDGEQGQGRRNGMLAVTSTWLLLALLGMIPMMASGTISDPLDAFYECVSGFTTTGSTLIIGVEHMPHSLIFFRSLIQWQGGVGIVVFTVAILPFVGGGISQVYNAETTGITHDRFLPRLGDVAKRLCMLYVGETLLLAVLLWAGPMGVFDAVCHAMSCISTGGFSSRDEGVLAFNSPYVEYVLTIFMYIGALNLTLVYFALIGQPKRLLRDEEWKWFSLWIAGIGLITTVWLYVQGVYGSVEECFRRAFFQVLALGTSTGYLTADINLWMPFFWMLALALMFVNGCAGSTSGGLKMARLIVLLKNLYNEFKKQIHPHLVTPVIFNRKLIHVSIVHQILAFCVLYILLIIVGSMLLMLEGNAFVESVTLACSALSNTGPALGGYMFDAYSLGVVGKCSMSLLMLAGRLEIFTVIGLLTPHFWRR